MNLQKGVQRERLGGAENFPNLQVVIRLTRRETHIGRVICNFSGFSVAKNGEMWRCKNCE